MANPAPTNRRASDSDGSPYNCSLIGVTLVISDEPVWRLFRADSKVATAAD
jgi:hypothetical protein